MVGLTPYDSTMLTHLVRHPQLSPRQQNDLLTSLEKPEARQVGEALLDPRKYDEAPPDVRATVDHFKKWLENEQRLARLREARRRTARPH
jgi:hypothetical protein